ncbi:aminopeptidase N-like [Nylanderia fulva]|uniref:aminopeptidase N-like n=1 Tax=Nylanderia fulva TaxID=613905 RepID=UPI0010FAD6ED|nr:aminopeptidase N-like [Nylanderia fulva]
MMNDSSVSDFWFKKGLTTWLATYAVDQTYPDFQIINLFVVQNQHYSFNLDGYYMWPSTSQVNSSLEIPNSIRAPFILRMMQHVLTDEIFQKGIRTYVYNLSHSDFMEVMRHPALIANDDIILQQTKMEDWALEKYCPLIKVERNYSDSMSPTNVRIQYDDTLKIRCISVTFTTQTFPDFNNFTHHMVCTEKDLKLSLPFEENGWMIFNIQQTGYYRVNYDERNWQRISNYLNYNNYNKIHVLNRAQIIDDAFHLLIAGQLHSFVFWDIIKYLQRERDYIAWYPFFKALEYLSSTFIVLEEEIEKLTSEVRQILHEILTRIEYEEIDDTDVLRNCLRQEAARWACFFGDITCKRVANNKLTQHLQDPAKYKLLPWWKEWTYCKGLMTTKSESTWHSVFDIGVNKADIKFLEYLACPENIDVIIYYLEYKEYHLTRRGDYQFQFNSFLHIITKHAKNLIILKYILDYFNELKPKNVSTTAALITIINNVYSVNQTKEINKYVQKVKAEADLFDKIKNTKHFNSSHIEKIFIKRISDKIERQISIRNMQIKRQRECFGRFFFW